MTAPQVDERTEADVVNAAACEASRHGTPPCDQSASYVARLTHRLAGTSMEDPMLVCHDHADALAIHNRSCLFCRLWVQLNLEPINRRPQ